MRKKGTRPLLRGLRIGAAVFVAALGSWLLWLVGDPAAAVRELARMADSANAATALLRLELGAPRQESGLSAWDRLVLAQSSLLGGTAGVPESGPTRSESPDSGPRETGPAGTGPLPTHSEPAETPPGNGGEENSLPPSTTAPDGIIPRTMVVGSSDSYIASGNVSVYNRTGYSLNIDALLEAAPALSAKGDGPKVLIYHSHATEAYTMDGTDIYRESEYYRTLDPEYNMVRIGEEMAAVFEAAGIEVIHDTTLYDYPSYNDAYNRSVEGMSALLKQYPSVVLVLDVHRDALEATDGTIYKVVAGSVDNCAQVMMVMGSDAGGSSHPNWRVNLALALSIQNAMAQKWATLARPTVLRTSRFNQHLSTGAILVEVGSHGNTLQEAITAARLYARTVVEMMTASEPS